MSGKLFWTLFTLAVGGSVYGCRKLYLKLKKDYEKTLKEKEALEQKEAKEKADFQEKKAIFNELYSDKKIASLTLSNDKLEELDDRSYFYDKLKEMKNNALICDYHEKDEFELCVSEFKDLYSSLKDLDKKALKAKKKYFMDKDKSKCEYMKRVQQLREEEQKHKRELEILREKRKSELDVYEAKLNVEKAKLETVCKAMSSTSNKNVQSQLNIKANLTED